MPFLRISSCISLNASVDLLRVAPPPTSRKFRRLAPNSWMVIHRGHRDPRAVHQAAMFAIERIYDNRVSSRDLAGSSSSRSPHGHDVGMPEQGIGRN